MDIQFTQAEKNAIHKLLRKEDTLCIVNLIDSEDYQLDVEWVDETPIAFESNKSLYIRLYDFVLGKLKNSYCSHKS